VDWWTQKNGRSFEENLLLQCRCSLFPCKNGQQGVPSRQDWQLQHPFLVLPYLTAYVHLALFRIRAEDVVTPAHNTELCPLTWTQDGKCSWAQMAVKYLPCTRVLCKWLTFCQNNNMNLLVHILLLLIATSALVAGQLVCSPWNISICA